LYARAREGEEEEEEGEGEAIGEEWRHGMLQEPGAAIVLTLGGAYLWRLTCGLGFIL